MKGVNPMKKIMSILGVNVPTWGILVLIWGIMARVVWSASTVEPQQPYMGFPYAITINSSFAANNKICTRWKAATSGTITELVARLNSGGTGKVKGVVYADNAGVPGALLGEGTEYTIDSLGQWTLDIPDVSVTGDTYYWLGYIVGTAAVDWYRSNDNNGYTNQTAYNADTYSDGAADPFGTVGAYYTRQTVIYAVIDPTTDDYLRTDRYCNQWGTSDYLDDRYKGSMVTFLPENGQLDWKAESLTVWCVHDGNDHKVRLGGYKMTSATGGDLLDTTVEFTVTETGWYSYPVQIQASVDSADSFFVLAWGEAATGDVDIGYMGWGLSVYNPFISKTVTYSGNGWSPTVSGVTRYDNVGTIYMTCAAPTGENSQVIIISQMHDSNTALWNLMNYNCVYMNRCGQ